MSLSHSETDSDGKPVIRELGIKDLPKFIELRQKIEHETVFAPAGRGERKETVLYALLKFLIQIRRGNSRTFIAEVDGEMVGFILLVFGRFRKFKGNAHIANVSVLSSMRGRGIGTELMKMAEEYALIRGSHRLELEVFGANVKAISLYEKLGFQIEGRKRQAVRYPDRYDDLVLMAKILS